MTQLVPPIHLRPSKLEGFLKSPPTRIGVRRPNTLVYRRQRLGVEDDRLLGLLVRHGSIVRQTSGQTAQVTAGQNRLRNRVGVKAATGT